MKTSFTKSGFGIALASAMLLTGTLLFQQTQAQTGVGINPSGNPAHASAGLDVDYSDKGLLIPRVGLTYSGDVSTIPSPATSLLVYNTATSGDVTPGFYYWDGSAWTRVQTGAGGGGGGGSDWTTVSNDTWLTNTSGHVGIGTSSPSSSYDLTLQGGYGGGFLVRGSTTNSKFEGNVGIGFSTSSSYDLDVDGHVHIDDGLRVGTTSSPPTGGILSSGDIKLNSSSASFLVGSTEITGSGTTTIASGLKLTGISSTSESTSRYVLCVDGSGNVYRHSSGGWAGRASGTGTSHSHSIQSSRLFKTNIQEFKFDKSSFLALRPYTYDYKKNYGGHSSLGLIAEDVAAVAPDLAHYGPKRLLDENGEVKFDAEGNEMVSATEQMPDGVYYERLGLYLLPIVAEHEETIESQQVEIADLRARLDRQEALLTKLTMGNPAFQNALENDGTLKAEAAPVKK